MMGPRSHIEGDDDVLMLLDISRALTACWTCVTIDGKVKKLLKAMYGLCDAGATFDRKVLDALNFMGVSLGKFSICVGFRKVTDTLVRPVRWGDAFSLSGRRSLCKAFRDEFGKHLLVKTTAVMGSSVEMGGVQEAIHLNRLLRLYPPGAEGRRAMGAGGRPSTRGNPGNTDGTKQRKQSCEYSWCADD